MLYKQFLIYYIFPEAHVISKREKQDFVESKSFIRGSGATLPNVDHLDDENVKYIKIGFFRVSYLFNYIFTILF